MSAGDGGAGAQFLSADEGNIFTELNLLLSRHLVQPTTGRGEKGGRLAKTHIGSLPLHFFVLREGEEEQLNTRSLNSNNTTVGLTVH